MGYMSLTSGAGKGNKSLLCHEKAEHLVYLGQAEGVGGKSSTQEAHRTA